jgi:hypothetical protein
MPVVNAVRANLVTLPNHAGEEMNVFLVPVCLLPTRMAEPIFQRAIGVSNKEEGSRQAVRIENRERPFKVASQSVVKGEGDYRLHDLFRGTAALSKKVLASRESPVSFSASAFSAGLKLLKDLFGVGHYI